MKTSVCVFIRAHWFYVMLLSCDRYISVIRAENNRQQVAGHDDHPNIFQPGQTPILAGQIMNTIFFFGLRNIELRWQ